MQGKQTIRDRIAQLQYLRKEKKDKELKLFYFIPILLSIFIYQVESKNLSLTIIFGLIIALTSVYLGYNKNAEKEELRIRNNYKKLNGN